MTTYSTPENFRQPILEWVKGREFVLIDDFDFQWHDGSVIKRITVPAGYNYDKASVPRFLWGIARPDGPWEAAALIHDRLYQFKGKLPAGEYKVQVGGFWHEDTAPWTRAQADDMLEWLGILGGASKAEAARYKWAVKLWPGNWLKGF